MNDEKDNTPTNPQPQRQQWWVYDRPLLKDWLFLVGLVVGIAWLSYTWTRPDANLIPGRIAFDIAWRPFWSIFSVGVVGGSIRNFVRSYRGR